MTLSSGPTFIASSSSSSAGTLVVNEIANYTATFIITQAALDSGSISNIATATGSSPGNTNDVSDQSDDGDDSDGIYPMIQPLLIYQIFLLQDLLKLQKLL